MGRKLYNRKGRMLVAERARINNQHISNTVEKQIVRSRESLYTKKPLSYNNNNSNSNSNNNYNNNNNLLSCFNNISKHDFVP